MTLLLRAIRWIALATWVGSIVFFAFGVAPLAFTTLPDAHAAGTLVAASLTVLHHIGLATGVIFAVTTLALLGTQRDSHPARAAELILALAMLALTVYSQYSIMPRMATDRLSLGGDVTKASPTAPARQNFDHLHHLSEKVEGSVLILGLIALVLGSMHGRDDFDRFA